MFHFDSSYRQFCLHHLLEELVTPVLCCVDVVLAPLFSNEPGDVLVLFLQGIIKFKGDGLFLGGQSSEGGG